MIPTKTYPLSAIMGGEISDKERIAELADAFNKLCAENADFVAQSDKDEARIAELERQLAESKVDEAALMEDVQRLCKEDLEKDERLAAVTAERDGLRRDAERYRHIRNRGSDFAITQCIGHDWQLLFGHDLDTAIDAALQSRPERRKGERRGGHSAFISDKRAGYTCVPVEVTEASEQPAEAVPVAWLHHCSDNEDKEFRCVDFESHHAMSVHRGDIPLYTHPQPAQGMVMVSRVELEDAWRQADAGNCLELSADLRHILDRGEK